MSNDPQWKTFQPPIMNSDPAILEYKSMAIPSPKAISGNHQTNSYRNGTNYNNSDYMDSPPACGKNSTMFNNYSGAQTSPRNGTSRQFPIGTFTGLEGTVNYSGEPVSNNSSYQSDQSANQGTRETGIIEKLLVSVLAEPPALVCAGSSNDLCVLYDCPCLLSVAALVWIHSMLRTTSALVFSFQPIQR